MRVTEITRQALKTRRDERDMLRDGWEYIGENGGNLWEIYRGCRIGHRITDVRISANGMGLWVKTSDDLASFRGARGRFNRQSRRAGW